ncbi:MAG: dephospho-CoA kinase [Acidimicrobiales bacterium]
MLELGLTGGIGSGKSTVAQLLVDKGAVLIDADQIVRELQEPGAPVYRAMVERWGQRILSSDMSPTGESPPKAGLPLDRQAVASIVFSDSSELTALNDIVHPPVAVEIAQRRDQLKGTDSVVINDIPLLVDANGDSKRAEYRHLKAIIVVDLPAEIAVERLVAFRGFRDDDARARIANQATREQRLALADFTIDNSGLVEDLEPQIDACWEWIHSLAHR